VGASTAPPSDRRSSARPSPVPVESVASLIWTTPPRPCAGSCTGKTGHDGANSPLTCSLRHVATTLRGRDKRASSTSPGSGPGANPRCRRRQGGRCDPAQCWRLHVTGNGRAAALITLACPGKGRRSSLDLGAREARQLYLLSALCPGASNRTSSVQA
jgi:hypothetical protein